MKTCKIILFFFVCFYWTLEAQWTNGQNADYVIGQSNFTSSSSGCSSTKLSMPYDAAVDLTNGKLYVVDMANHRVLRYSYPITSNQPAAEIAFGQPDLNSNAELYTAAANVLTYPSAVAIKNDVLWICDQMNNRILKFNNASTISSSGPNADVVLGQTAFGNRTPNCTQSTLNSPYDITIDNSGTLWVADANNNRVLRFDNANSKSSGANADGVLGQNTYTTSVQATTSSGMNFPTGLVISNENLFVADMMNNRILRFDNASSKPNGGTADGVLGQSVFTTSTSGSTAGKFNMPFKVEVDNSGRLYVADQGNSRYLLFNSAAGKSNGADADNVLGQPDFSTTSEGTTQSKMNFPNGSSVDNTNNKIIISDEQNNRVLVFTASSPLPVELFSFSAKVNNYSVILEWQTATEVNNYGFEILRRSAPQNDFSNSSHEDKGQGTSGEGQGMGNMGQRAKEWMVLGFVQGNSNSNSMKTYTFTDNTPPAGKVQYRLKQIDNDGSFKYSEYVEVNVGVPSTTELHQNYPNPFNPSTSIRFNLSKESKIRIIIYDLLGNVVNELVNEVKSAGSHIVYWNSDDNEGKKVASGVYFYELVLGNGLEQFHQIKKMNLLR